jgi:CBS domain-containing protein
MTIGAICTRDVDLAEQDESVQIAAERMTKCKVGTLMVLDEQSKPVGILTDRDLTTRVVAQGLDPNTTVVRDVMTKSPESIDEDTPIEVAISCMRQCQCRRLPVIDEQGKLAGIISLDDIVDLLSDELDEIGELLRSESPTRLL